MPEKRQRGVLPLYIKVHYGRKPYYQPWVELFGIDKRGNAYFRSSLEETLLRLFSLYIDPGGRIYVEQWDGCEWYVTKAMVRATAVPGQEMKAP